MLAIGTERVCMLLDWISCRSPPSCLYVDMSVRKSLEAGRWFQCACRESQHTAGFRFPCLPAPQISDLSSPCTSRCRHRARCCDMHWWTEQLLPSRLWWNSSRGGEDEQRLPTSDGLVAVDMSQAWYAQISKTFHFKIKLQRVICSIPLTKTFCLEQLSRFIVTTTSWTRPLQSNYDQARPLILLILIFKTLSKRWTQL